LLTPIGNAGWSVYLLHGIVDGSGGDVDVVDVVCGLVDIVGGRIGIVVVGVLVVCGCRVVQQLFLTVVGGVVVVVVVSE